MSETKNYIMELELLDGCDSLVYLEADGKPVKRFFASAGVSGPALVQCDSLQYERSAGKVEAN